MSLSDYAQIIKYEKMENVWSESQKWTLYPYSGIIDLLIG